VDGSSIIWQDLLDRYVALPAGTEPVAKDQERCDLARDLAKQGFPVYDKLPDKGCKLFLLARNLCSSDQRFDVNLGVAMYKNHRYDEALAALKRTVEAGNKAINTLRLYAEVQLAAGESAGRRRPPVPFWTRIRTVRFTSSWPVPCLPRVSFRGPGGR